MRKYIGTFVIGLVALATIGYFRGWLSLSSGDEDGKAKLEISIDKAQLKEDTSRLKEGAKSLVDRIGSGESQQEQPLESEIDFQDGMPEL